MSPRRAGEIAALGLGIAVFGYLGWDGALWDARLQLLLHLAAVAAVAALLGIAWAGGSLPRTRLDVPILVLLVAFGLGALTAWNHGLSARALASILATAAMLPVALLVLRHRPGWVALVVTLPVLALSAGSLAVLGWRRVEWLLAGGPGLPPIRLGGEGTPFGSVAVPPFVILAALPLALLIPQPRLRLGVLLGLAAVGVPLTLLSGSRSAWLAILATTAVLLAPRLSGRLPRFDWRSGWTPRRAALAFGGIVLGLLGLVYIAPRLLEAGSLAYRGFLWRDTLAAWSVDPLLGIGPGSMPFARQVAAPPLTFPARQPHSHDVPLGILGDAGLVGLAAGLVVVVVFVRLAGPWATRSLPGRAAFAVLAGFGVGMLFEDLTFLPNFNLMVLLLVAMALTDAGGVTWQRPGLDVLGVRGVRGARLAAAAGALALALVLVLGDGAAIAYREGVEAYNQERWTDATSQLATSASLDPWQPTTPKALALAADRSGRPELARRAAHRGVALNPGDGPGWTNLALLCLGAGERDCAATAADGAIARTTTRQELVNAALVHEALGNHEAADRAYRLSALTNFWTTITVPWPRPVSFVADDVAGLDELGDTVQFNEVIALGVLRLPIEPDAYTNVHARILAHAFAGDYEQVASELDRATSAARAAPLTWDLAALLARPLGRDPEEALRIAQVARGIPPRNEPPSPPGLSFDIATFRAYPGDELVAAAERLLPEVPWPWVLEPYLAAP